MSFHSFREGSRKDHGQDIAEGYRLCNDQLQLGAILRIADAAEVMAKNHQQLINERDAYLRSYKQEEKETERLRGTIRGLRSYISVLKKGLDR